MQELKGDELLSSRETEIWPNSLSGKSLRFAKLSVPVTEWEVLRKIVLRGKQFADRQQSAIDRGGRYADG